MAKFIKTKAVKPENIEVGNSIEVHADSLATFKTYVSRYNKPIEDKAKKMKYEYSGFSGSFCTAKRLS